MRIDEISRTLDLLAGTLLLIIDNATFYKQEPVKVNTIEMLKAAREPLDPA